MALRRMLAVLKGDGEDAGLLARAFAVAQAQGARLDALFVRRSARSGADFLGDAFSVYGLEPLLQDLEAAASQAALKAKAAFEAAAAEAPDAHIGQFIDFVGLPEDAMQQQAALSDLVILARPAADGDAALEDAVRLVLLSAGRPVLILPPGEAGVFKRVMAAFDGSREAAHALTGALDFLTAAEDVDLVTLVEDKPGADHMEVAERYLALHGVHADCLEIDRDGRALGEALISAAADHGADLLVMGGFGSAAWLDPAARGASRGVLRKAGCAILMSH